jgi:hypothetical protein
MEREEHKDVSTGEFHPISEMMRQAALQGRRSIIVPKEMQAESDWDQVREILKQMNFTLTVHGRAGRYKVSW